jgi:hypothetical protein
MSMAVNYIIKVLFQMKSRGGFVEQRVMLSSRFRLDQPIQPYQ